ncbi:alpha/beta hydrolase [Georgenia sp. Z1491]|uniref:alpha/beta hydrolase n=1 Tax=Georgenia sp. Z1491 TaxID=3416707 RepID=UPI003CF00448
MTEIQLGDIRARWWGAEPADAEVAVLAVHGRGQTTDYMTAVLDRLPGGLPAVAALLPQAADCSWYPERFVAPIEQNQPWLDDALATVTRGLDALAEAGLPRQRVVVLGFSQGSCLLSTFLLQESGAAGLAGAALFAGGYVGPRGMAPPTGDASLDGLPVRMALAEADDLAPLFRTEETVRALVERGAEVRLDVLPGEEHVVADSQVEALAELVRDAAAG